MSDTVTNGSLDAFLLDGDTPRLGAAQPLQPSSSILDYEQLASEPNTDGTPPLPAPRRDAEPVLLALAGPSLPSPFVASATDSDTDQAAAQRHPMAHLMPEKMKPNESSIRAAQIRAAKKSKARKKKALAAVVFLAVAAVVGPPLGKWLVDAINESGSTKSDEPTPTVPAAAGTTTPGAPATSAPVAAAPGLAGLPGAADAAVAAVNADAAGDLTGDSATTAPVTTVVP